MSIHPQDASFTGRAERLLSNLETSVDRIADDLDIDVLRAGNVITLTFEDGHRIVANSQEAAQEVWLAARTGGFHYRWNDEQQAWCDTRSGEELRVVLSRLIEIEVGVAPALAFEVTGR